MRYAVVLLLAILSAIACRSDKLAEQKRCSIQAAKVDAKPGWPHGSRGHGYNSHYNPATNTCYVMFHDDYGPKTVPAKSLYIEDAFNEWTYGIYSEMPAGNMIECTFLAPDKVPHSLKDYDNCHSEAEFRALASKLYGIAQ